MTTPSDGPAAFLRITKDPERARQALRKALRAALNVLVQRLHAALEEDLPARVHWRPWASEDSGCETYIDSLGEFYLPPTETDERTYMHRLKETANLPSDRQDHVMAAFVSLFESQRERIPSCSGPTAPFCERDGEAAGS